MNEICKEDKNIENNYDNNSVKFPNWPYCRQCGDVKSKYESAIPIANEKYTECSLYLKYANDLLNNKILLDEKKLLKLITLEKIDNSFFVSSIDFDSKISYNKNTHDLEVSIYDQDMKYLENINIKVSPNLNDKRKIDFYTDSKNLANSKYISISYNNDYSYNYFITQRNNQDRRYMNAISLLNEHNEFIENNYYNKLKLYNDNILSKKQDINNLKFEINILLNDKNESVKEIDNSIQEINNKSINSKIKIDENVKINNQLNKDIKALVQKNDYISKNIKLNMELIEGLKELKMKIVLKNIYPDKVIEGFSNCPVHRPWKAPIDNNSYWFNLYQRQGNGVPDGQLDQMCQNRGDLVWNFLFTDFSYCLNEYIANIAWATCSRRYVRTRDKIRREACNNCDNYNKGGYGKKGKQTIRDMCFRYNINNDYHCMRSSGNSNQCGTAAYLYAKKGVRGNFDGTYDRCCFGGVGDSILFTDDNMRLMCMDMRAVRTRARLEGTHCSCDKYFGVSGSKGSNHDKCNNWNMEYMRGKCMKQTANTNQCKRAAYLFKTFNIRGNEYDSIYDRCCFGGVTSSQDVLDSENLRFMCGDKRRVRTIQKLKRDVCSCENYMGNKTNCNRMGINNDVECCRNPLNWETAKKCSENNLNHIINDSYRDRMCNTSTNINILYDNYGKTFCDRVARGGNQHAIKWKREFCNNCDNYTKHRDVCIDSRFGSINRDSVCCNENKNFYFLHRGNVCQKTINNDKKYCMNCSEDLKINNNPLRKGNNEPIEYNYSCKLDNKKYDKFNEFKQIENNYNNISNVNKYIYTIKNNKNKWDPNSQFNNPSQNFVDCRCSDLEGNNVNTYCSSVKDVPYLKDIKFHYKTKENNDLNSYSYNNRKTIINDYINKIRQYEDKLVNSIDKFKELFIYDKNNDYKSKKNQIDNLILFDDDLNKQIETLQKNLLLLKNENDNKEYQTIKIMKKHVDKEVFNDLKLKNLISNNFQLNIIKNNLLKKLDENNRTNKYLIDEAITLRNYINSTGVLKSIDHSNIKKSSISTYVGDYNKNYDTIIDEEDRI